MSNQANNRIRCSVGDTGRIYYDVDSIDVNVDPTKTKSTAFEALFLSDVISEITGSCFTIEENCKSQYPLITRENSTQWITSIDQENRVGLAHVLETSKVPILYNTPRLCDPGMTISKNWSLKNYIETRLFAFKYKFNLGKTLLNRNQNGKDCYTSVYFDFRPFEYKMRLPNPVSKNAKEEIYITEWITVEGGKDGGLGYTPHMRVSNKPFTVSNTNSSKYQTLNIFKRMVKKVLMSQFGNNVKSVIKNAINLGPDNNMNVNAYINEFIQFIIRYDGVQFDIQAATATQTLNMTDRAISVLYYDLIHDKVFKKAEYKLEKFKSTFKKQFKIMALEKNANVGTEFDFLVGAKMAANSHNAYKGKNGNILLSEWGAGRLKSDASGKVIPVIPSIFKTLGDLSQFVYAVTYNTVVASGDKMGMACGLFMTASNGRKLKLMMEDAVTGFVLYTGFDKIQFVSRSSCITKTGGACVRSNNNTIRRKNAVVNRIQTSISSQNMNTMKNIIKRKPYTPNLLSIASRVFNPSNTTIPININSSKIFFAKVERFLPHFTEQELAKVERILSAIESRTKSNNKNTINRYLRALRRSIASVKAPPPLKNINQQRANGQITN